MKIAKIILAVAMFLCNLTAGTAQDNRDLDLPVSPENKTIQVPSLPPIPLPADDPQDEPSPTIYGEEIEAENGTLIYQSSGRKPPPSGGG